MKNIYKIILFFAIFEVTVLMINAMDIFPNELYSDSDTELEKLESSEGPWEIVRTLFVPSSNSYISNIGIAGIVGLFVIGGGVAAYFSHGNMSGLVIVFFCYVFFTMITNSIGFFDKIFRHYNEAGSAMVYLGVCLGVAIFIIFIITIVETPTHGRS